MRESALPGPPVEVRQLATSRKPVTIGLLLAALGILVLLPDTLGASARLTLFAFGAATIFWSCTKLDAGYVALGAVLFTILTGAVGQDALPRTLESGVIWLMIGAFITGAAVEQTGLAKRLAMEASRRVRTVNGMLWMTSAVLVPLTFLIPSTSGRAAVMLPMFRSLIFAAGRSAATRALALLIPVVVLVSTIATITGAGSHLIAVDLLKATTDRSISYWDWMIWGAPFAIVASGVSTWLISRMFLTSADRAVAMRVDLPDPPRLSRNETTVLLVFAAMLAMWSTERFHGFGFATTSILGAVLICAPRLGAITWEQGLRGISWSLVIFVGAALVLGEALISTGAAQWLIDGMMRVVNLRTGATHPGILVGLGVITLTAHIYMTSHAARTAALLPPLLYLAGDLQIDPVTVTFLATLGINYCLTMPVSSKALLIFQEMDPRGRMSGDLLRLSSVLMPVHLLLILVFYYGYWRHVGLAL